MSYDQDKLLKGVKRTVGLVWIGAVDVLFYRWSSGWTWKVGYRIPFQEGVFARVRQLAFFVCQEYNGRKGKYQAVNVRSCSEGGWQSKQQTVVEPFLSGPMPKRAKLSSDVAKDGFSQQCCSLIGSGRETVVAPLAVAGDRRNGALVWWEGLWVHQARPGWRGVAIYVDFWHMFLFCPVCEIVYCGGFSRLIANFSGQ